MMQREADVKTCRVTVCRAVVLAICLLLTACAGAPPYADGKRLLDDGRFEEGLDVLRKAMNEHQGDQELRAYYFRQREFAAGHLGALGDNLRAAGQPEAAEALYRRTLAIDPNSARAKLGLEFVAMDLRHRSLVANSDKLIKAGDFGAAAGILRTVLAENPNHREARALQRLIDEKTVKDILARPTLKSTHSKPITLEFREGMLRSVFEVLSRATDINFVFDKDVRADLRTTIFVKEVSLEDAIRLLLVSNQLEQKVINHNTILIYPNTPAKNREYQELLVKAFYLANADAKQTMNLVRTILKPREVYVDEKLNMLVVRDTPEAVRLVEKLIASQDLAEPEVMLEVEVLEIKRSLLTDIGIQWPNQFTVLNLATTNTVTTSAGTVVATTPTVSTNPLTLNILRHLDPSKVGITPVILNLRKDEGNTNLLANPRIRVKNREKAKIHIGDRVPVITTTVTANVGVSESVSYLDVGIKLDVEPNIYLEDDVAIKVGLEVSNIVREIRSSTGTLTYQLGTRSATTTLRLKDSETQVLGGLINDEDRKSVGKIPGIGDLPIVGRLFSTHRDDATKTEIILLVTPHVVRNVIRPEAAITEFLSGTETATGAAAPAVRGVAAGAAAAPVQPAQPAAAAPPSPTTLKAPTDPVRRGFGR